MNHRSCQNDVAVSGMYCFAVSGGSGAENSVAETEMIHNTMANIKHMILLISQVKFPQLNRQTY